MMKQFIFAIIFAIIGNSILGEEQFRQCNCEEQQKCIEEINDEIEGCIDECEVTVDLKSAVNESTNIGPCMEKHKKIISNFYDCLNDQCSTKESCLQGNESEKQKMPFFDFETILIKFLRPMAEKSHNQMKEIGKGLDIDFVKIGLDLNKCAQDCAFKKVPNLNCFQKAKCSLKLTEQQLKESMGKCTKKTQPKQKINEVCECFQQNGVGNLKPFCEKLEKTEIPLEI